MIRYIEVREDDYGYYVDENAKMEVFKELLDANDLNSINIDVLESNKYEALASTTNVDDDLKVDGIKWFMLLVRYKTFTRRRTAVIYTYKR